MKALYTPGAANQELRAKFFLSYIEYALEKK